MKSKMFFVGGVLVLLMTIGVTWALAQSDGAYFACVNNASGTIHMVNEGETCNNNEMLVEWNKIGPPGLQGPQGDPGLQGPKGDQGPPVFFGVYDVHEWTTIEPGEIVSLPAWCELGDIVTGGGVMLDNMTPYYDSCFFLAASMPQNYPGGYMRSVYFAKAKNNCTTDRYLDVTAVCMDVTP